MESGQPAAVPAVPSEQVVLFRAAFARFTVPNCLQLMESAEPELMNEPLETFEVECAEGEHELQTPWSWWFDKKVSVLLTSVKLCEFHQSVSHTRSLTFSQPHISPTISRPRPPSYNTHIHWLTKGNMPPRFCRVALPFFVCAVSICVCCLHVCCTDARCFLDCSLCAY